MFFACLNVQPLRSRMETPNIFWYSLLRGKINPLTLVPAVTGNDEHWPSDIITFDQNWHSCSSGERYLFINTHIRVMGSAEPEIHVYPKMLRNLSEKLTAKFPFSLLSYSMVSNACAVMFSPKFLNWKVQSMLNHCCKKIW